MEAAGPIVKPGEGYREIIARPSMNRETVRDIIRWRCVREIGMMYDRMVDIESGLVHQTPAMTEALAKLSRIDA